MFSLTKNIIIPDTEGPFYFKPGRIVSVIGPTGVGKSHLVAKILRDREQLVKPKPHKVLYVYNIWQEELYKQIAQWCPNVEFIRGLDNLWGKLSQAPATNPTILVLDDQQQQLADSKDLGIQLMTAGVHHLNILCFFIGQSLFLKAKHTVLINRNSSYVIMFRNKRSMFECEQMGRQALQLTPSQVRNLYKDASQYGERCYLLYDLNPETSEYRQLTTNILNDDPQPKFFYYIHDGKN